MYLIGLYKSQIMYVDSFTVCIKKNEKLICENTNIYRIKFINSQKKNIKT